MYAQTSSKHNLVLLKQVHILAAESELKYTAYDAYWAVKNKKNL